MAYDKPVVVPKRIFPFKTAVHGFDVGALFQRRLSGMHSYIFEVKIMRGKQRTFTLEFGIFYLLHNLIFFHYSF